MTYLRRKRKAYVALRPETMTPFTGKIDQWMEGTVWTTRCSNYFRAANGRVVAQWPRSARSFWSMTRRFRAADYMFRPAVRSDRRRSARSDDGETVTAMGAPPICHISFTDHGKTVTLLSVGFAMSTANGLAIVAPMRQRNQGL